MPGEGFIADPFVGSDARFREDTRAAIGQLWQRPKFIVPDSLPMTPFPGRAPSTTWYTAITDNPAAAIWYGVANRVTHSAVYVEIPWRTDATTPGTLSLALGVVGGGGATSGSIQLPGGSAGTAKFQWMHGIQPWSLQTYLYVYASRVSGAGYVNVGYPSAFQVGPDGCTANGTHAGASF